MKIPGGIATLPLILVYSAAHAATPTLTTIHTFGGFPSDGSGPGGNLVMGSGGVLYGAAGGGKYNVGTGFSLIPRSAPGAPWTEAFWSVPNCCGVGQAADILALGADGVLYGGTALIPYSDIFSLHPPATAGGHWMAKKIAGGAPPFFLLAGVLAIGSGGVLYGVTSGGANTTGEVFSLTPPASPHAGWTATVIHTFSTGCCDAQDPGAGVVVGADGVLYGTTYFGGPVENGTVYSLTPPSVPGGTWMEAPLYFFAGGSDGANPKAPVVIGRNGVLYGTTMNGGSGSQNLGTVFSLTPPASPGSAWTEAVLHRFAGGSDGANPFAGLTIGPNGVLYGTTFFGGTANAGTIYSLTPPSSPGGSWQETVLHTFTGDDGAGPAGPVVIGRDGALYGTTTSGGTGAACWSGCGTAFELR